MAQDQNNDERLNQAMQSWTVGASLPPRFKEEVWHRIARIEAQVKIAWWKGLLNRAVRAWPRPVWAAACLSMFLIAGVAAGYRQAQIKSERVDDLLAQRYAQSVVPHFVIQK